MTLPKDFPALGYLSTVLKTQTGGKNEKSLHVEQEDAVTVCPSYIRNVLYTVV